ncbi:hypothetical protein PAXRUDRAFT_830910 [Paxillus rubicundulus Ve08.2h10]|uniref:Uncharacterized protein n=1 Tax=Paxillus rubicundulus Ve08.2h10 TaxID=930991 RepID=A0A0D0DXZ3_9AGAM|nr:hypothetical protein PAXRUDRAFT_830910 [Paxillus rubicundulus Ve08.2h10]
MVVFQGFDFTRNGTRVASNAEWSTGGAERWGEPRVLRVGWNMKRMVSSLPVPFCALCEQSTRQRVAKSKKVLRSGSKARINLPHLVHSPSEIALFHH